MPERLGRVLAPKVTERRQTDEVAKRLSGLPIRHIDWTLLAITFFLIGFGMLMLYSATRGDNPGNPTYYVFRQGVSMIIGLILMVLLLSFDYRRLKVATPFIYSFFLFFLGIVFFWGKIMGSARWITWGPLSFQPSEFCKLVLILVLANFFSDNKAEPESFRSFITPVAWTLPYLLLVFLAQLVFFLDHSYRKIHALYLDLEFHIFQYNLSHALQFVHMDHIDHSQLVNNK